jgi:predicted metal-dependent HD superfamily phosphohydrolase
MWVLRHVEAMLADDEFLAVDGDAVRLAALFHDLVYDPRSSTNEADSSRLAVAFAHALGWRSERRALVGSLIEATAHHRADTDDAIVLLDADLAILGSDPASYQAYVAGVRGEYAHLPEAEWRAGRSAVLRHFLGLSELFRSSYLRSKEQRARANMAAELAALGR